MRTTLTIDDAIAEALKKEAFESKKSFKAVVNETLARGLQPSSQSKPRKYRMKTFNMGGARSEIDLVKANQLSGDLEDEEIARKLELRR